MRAASARGLVWRRGQAGYTVVDLVMGLTLLGLVMLVLYQVFLPTFALSRNTDERLDRQQDVRLAIDRLARLLHETTVLPQRTVIYTTGCSDAYEGCIGFPTARPACAGPFQLSGGFPLWQATIYVWRDVASSELRLRCDTTTTIPSATWPPMLTPFEVVARHVVHASFARQGNGIEIRLREQAPLSARGVYRYQHEFSNQTVFVPQNP